MGFQRLKLETLAKLDPRLAAAFEQALQRVVEDCRDRPGDKTPRKVTFELTAKPCMDETGESVELEMSVDVKHKVPARKSRAYRLITDRRNGLMFSEHNPESTDQTTIDDIDPETGRVRRDLPAEE